MSQGQSAGEKAQSAGPNVPSPSKDKRWERQEKAASAEESVGTLTQSHPGPPRPHIFLKPIREFIQRIFARAHAVCQTMSPASGTQQGAGPKALLEPAFS